MATIQGMCKNCGALIIFDDRDDKCECVFCNCIFPSAQAVEIFENPDGVVFPNEKYEASTENKHYHTTRVFSDDNIQNAIKHSKTSGTPKAEKNEFEISANDVKAPKKLVLGMIAALAVAVIVIIVVATPMYNTRKELTASISNNIDTVFADVVNVDTSLDANGKTVGYLVYGQTCQSIKFFTEDDVTEADAITLFENYCELRSSSIGDSSVSYKNVEMLIYANNGIFSVVYSGNEIVVTEN